MSNPSITDLTKRKLALDPAQSFIVQAPAGSGKTTLLVTRYLRLLSLVNNPEEVLAITFTRKAAFEMRTRIIEALKQANEKITSKDHYQASIQKLAKAALKQDQIKKWHIVQNPNRLRIQTIDAFCYYLVSQAPIFTKINPRQQIVQNQDREIYYRKAAQAIFENLTDSEYAPYLERLLLYLNNDWERAVNLFITMLKSREQWLPHIVGLKNTHKLRKKMGQALQEISQENIERCIALFPKELYKELITLLQFSQNHIEFTSNTSTITLTHWQRIANILLTKEFTWRKKVTSEQGFPTPNSKAEKKLCRLMKARMEELLNKFNEYENLRVSLANLLLSPPAKYDNEQWEIIESLLELLPLLVAHLKIIFDENMLTDHTEISLSTLRVLGEEEIPSELALNLDYQLQHLLVDEFQDTSLSHYRLLEKLINTWQPNDGRTIFLVGDPMQSIYRFREAEVGLFLRTQREGIGNIKLHSIILNANFRSSPNIIAWINSNFTKILPTLTDISLGAVSFNPSVATVNDPPGHIEINLLEDTDEKIEASHVVSIVQKILHQHPNDTIAILVKARSHLTNITTNLRNANLNYQGCELETLSESLVIKDLFSLTQALFDPTDRIAWVSILRAPWCGLTLEDLYKVVRGEAKLIWDNICNYQKLSNLSEDGRSRLIKFKAALLPIFTERGRMIWRDLIEKTWLMLGGPATVNNIEELDNIEAYLELLTEPLNIANLQKKLTGLYIAPTLATTQIQIMTIHKAKGLEFDHVIIPSINRTTRFDDRKLLRWFERPKLHQGSNLILAPIAANGNKTNQVYQYLQTVEQKKSWYETGRLLYVAMTRAKKSIYLTGLIKNTAKINMAPRSLLEQLNPCFTKDWIRKKTARMEATDPRVVKPVKISRFTNDWTLPVTINLPLHNNKCYFALNDNQANIIGTVLHHCLRQISESNLANWNSTNQLPYWRKLLQQSRYIDLETGLKIIHEAITLTLNDAKGRWILSQHQEARNEWAITSKNDNNFEHYIIDRTFIDEKGYRWIIDYKTSKPGSKNIQEFLQIEKIKHTPQLLQYAKIMRAFDPNKPIKLGLYYPRFSGWLEII
ncbi:MAG: UvrD-helicase domain-containing protein [Coxiellaceae bacterium]|jgi:ATP-dependent exoDNAse (exonuclease V) beta subunit|nr:UvrD-helicase domain-containing protein [Coxiellaceae bacterium]